MSNVIWTIEQGVDFIRKWEPEAAKLGFHLGIMGGVLMKGYSEKDLDVLVCPLKTEFEHHFAKFKDLFGQDIEWKDTTPYHPGDTKRVWSAEIDSKRIDFFYLQ